MNFRLTMILSVVLMLLAIGVLLIPNKKADTTSTASGTPLLSVPPANINIISFASDGADQLKFARLGDNWQMTYPVAAPAQAYLLKDIADDLKAVSYRQKFEPESTGNHTPEATGIAKPRYVVKFTDDVNREYTLNFGTATIDGIYATFNNAKTIYLLDKAVLDKLDKKPDDFRDKVMSKSETTKVTGLTLKTAEGTFALQKTNDKWLLTAPVNARANTATIDEMLREMSTITANTFTKLKRADARLDQPVASVTIQLEESSPPATAPTTAAATATKPAGKVITLDLGVYTDITKKSAVYAALAGSDTVFTLRSDSFNKLNRELKDLRDPAVTPAPVANATEFSVTSLGKTVAASKKEDKWTLTIPPNITGDTFAIGDFLGALRDLRAIRFVDNAGNPASLGLDPPQSKIELTIPGQSQHEVLLIGKSETDDKGGKVTSLMRQGESTVYLLQSADIDRLAVSPITFRDKQIDPLAGDTIRTMSVTGPAASGGGFTLEREGSKWTLKTGTGAAAKSTPADDSKISPFLADFTPLTAVKYLDDKSVPSGTPDLTVTLSILEPTIKPAASVPATSTAPATAAATSPALPGLNLANTMGPDPGKITTRTLRLFKSEAPATAPTTASSPLTTAPSTATGPTWKALYESQTPSPWTFEPQPTLITHLTKETYATPTTQPTTTAPAQNP